MVSGKKPALFLSRLRYLDIPPLLAIKGWQAQAADNIVFVIDFSQEGKYSFRVVPA